MRRRSIAIALIAWGLGAAGPGFAAAPTVAASALGAEQVDFNFHVRPLLSDRCYKCHGPDERSRKGKLRLDLREEAFKRNSDGKPIVQPGNPGASELIRRIQTTDADDMMPPPDSNLSLTADEKRLLEQWVAQGAEWKSHWAFLPIAAPPIPGAGAKAAGAANPIDVLVRERQARHGLRPNAEAGRAVLIRRVSLDLLGLPPNPEDVESFLADPAADAYERLVDRLLASPAYGERMATEWLDLARYADTYGYQADVERDLSPWRDWVIGAFNANLPYDKFVLWQLAGDLLPEPTLEQRLATAFNRLHRQTNEGGSIDEEFRVEYVADRVHTMGTAFLGLTLECSRCHDHKYDPVSQRDYYRLFAFLDNIDESGLYSHFTQATPTPTLLLYAEGQEAAHQRARERVAAAERACAEAAAQAVEPFKAWRRGAGNRIVVPSPAAAFAFDEAATNRTPNAIAATNAAEFVDGPELVPGRRGKAVQFSGDNAVVAKRTGEFHRSDAFTIALDVFPVERQERSVVFHRSRAWSDSGSRGYELVLDAGRPQFSLIHFWPGNAVSVIGREPLPTNAWSHLAVTYDGSSRASGLTIYVDGRRLETETVRDALSKDIVHRSEWGDADAGSVHFTLGARFRDSGFRQGRIDELLVFDRWLTPLEVRAVALRAAEPSGPSRWPWGAVWELPEAATGAELRALFVERRYEPYGAGLAELKQARAAENRASNEVREIMTMRELAPRRVTHVLKRGAYDARGEAVEPGTPEQILPFPQELPRNRLGLARWMLDRRHPLTARVAVNRIWKLHFGRGLVATVEDFGSQGQLPTHPELLDWLAADFMDSGWDRKRLHRMIVTSATYRQSSLATPEAVAADPANVWLARGPKHRLQAEQIRDQALAASGLLVARMGGPSVRPYQPAGVWEESGTGKTYHQDKGEKLYRRSLYTFWRRTAPPPSMLNFDATSREVCAAKREVTATPLQALVLLNDPQYLEAGRVLAEAVWRAQPKDEAERITEMMRRILGRTASVREQATLERLYREQVAYFAAHPDAAERYLGIGDRVRDRSLPLVETAATAVVANALMNHDEFVMKR
jgi:hypothetical protein